MRTRRPPLVPWDGMMHIVPGHPEVAWTAEDAQSYGRQIMVGYDRACALYRARGLEHPENWRRDPAYFWAKKVRRNPLR